MAQCDENDRKIHEKAGNTDEIEDQGSEDEGQGMAMALVLLVKLLKFRI
jgi:hypothetical protein